MPTLLDALTLRFEADQSSRTPMPNLGTASNPVLYKGSPYMVQLAVFKGTPSSANFVDDLSDISGASLLIRANNSDGPVLIEKVLDPDQVNGTLTYSEWLAGTGAQFEFQLSDVDTNQTVPTDSPLDIYGAVSLSTPSGPLTVGVFRGILIDDGVANPGPPPDPNYTSYSRSEVDNLLANINPAQGLGNVTGPNGSMIGHIAIFSNNTGQNLDDSGILYTDLVVNTAVVHVTGNENVAGVKTFSASPIVPDVTALDSTGKVANTNFVTSAISTLNTSVTSSLAGKQPLDATLTALAGLTTAADKLIYATGVDTFSTTTLSAFARTFLDDPDAATVRATLGVGTGSGDTSTNTSTSVDGELVLFNSTSGKSLKRATGTGLVLSTSGVASFVADNRTNWDTAYTDRNKWDGGLTGLVAATGRTSLGLVIGTNVQAWDSDLDAVAALSTQSFGLGLLTKSDAATIRTYLGVGTGSGDLSSAISSSTIGRLAVFSTTTGKGIGQIGTAASRGLDTDIWIAIRPDTVDGIGTAEDPRNVYDTTPTLMAVKFDAIMLSLGTYVRIRLFPGTYYTNHAVRTWYVLNGWEIIGAGMYRTTVQSLGVLGGGDPTFHAPNSVGGASSVVIRDLSIDINWGGRANSFTDSTASVGTLTLTSATTSSATVTATGRLVSSNPTRDFDATDIGRRVTGTGVPSNTWIGAVTATTISLSSSPVANTAVIATISNGTVLTVREKHAACSAIYLSGNNNLVENVRAINGYGDAVDSNECFWIGLSAGAIDGSNNRIRACRAETPWGTYNAPFAIHGYDDGGAGVWINDSSVTGCTALGLNTGYNKGFTSGGVNMAYTRRCRVSGNDFVDCFSIVYHDTGGYEDPEVSDNTLLRGSYGVAFDVTSSSYAAMTKKGVRVIDNRIGLQNKLTGHSYGVILNGNGTESTSHLVTGNTITFLTTGGGYAQYHPVSSNAVAGKYINNVCDAGDTGGPTGTNTVISGNRTPTGGTVTGLEDNVLQGFTLTALQALRRNAANTAFETYTPSTAGNAIATDTLWDALGDLVYGSGADTGAKLAGNTTTTVKFLAQTGTGTVSAAPVWTAFGISNIPLSAASRLLGRGSAAGGGVAQEITLSGGLSMSGTVLSSVTADDTAFASSWNGVTTIPPSKNAVWDALDGFAVDPTSIADFDDATWATGLSGSMPTLNGNNAFGGINTFGDEDIRISAAQPNGALYTTDDAPRIVKSVTLGDRQALRRNTASVAMEAYRAIWTDDAGMVTDQMLASAVKPAVAVVSASNLTRSGEQTIDGVTTSASLVLLTAQTTGSQNGPWVTASGTWTRPSWYSGGSTTQAPQFLTTFVRLGTTYQGSTWRMTTASVQIDTTSTTWVQTPTNVNSATGTLAVGNGGTGIAAFGSGVATFLGTPSSANLRAALTDENGTGAALFDSATNPTFDGATINNGSLTISGNISSAAWTTSGLRIKGIAGTLTDTTSSGTVAAAYTNKLGGNTIAASSATTFTNYMSGYFSEPVAGSGVTFTNKWALGADSLYVGTSNPLKVTSAGVLTATSPVLTTPDLGTPSALVGTNITGTAAAFNINGTVGATTPAAGTFTTGVFGSTTSLLLGTAGSAVGNIGFRNATSGTATLAPPTGALGTYSVTLPNAASTLPIFGQQITFSGPTAARTYTLPDSSVTLAEAGANSSITSLTGLTTTLNSDLRMYQALGSSVKAFPLNVTPERWTSQLGFGSGQFRFVAVYIPVACTITGVKWIQAIQGSYTGNNYNGVALYSYSAGSITLVASSTNDANIWTVANDTVGTKAFSSTYSAAAGVYFVAGLYSSSAQTTQPKIYGVTTGLVSPMATLDLTNSATTFGMVASQTALPSPQSLSGAFNNAMYGFMLY